LLAIIKTLVTKSKIALLGSNKFKLNFQAERSLGEHYANCVPQLEMTYSQGTIKASQVVVLNEDM